MSYRSSIEVARLTAGLLVGASLAISAHQRTQTAGTASISGVVLSTDDIPKPIGRAVVSLTDPAQFIDRHTVSNDDGQFDFELVPPGRYFLEAKRPSYVSIAYGSARPGRPGTPIVIEANRPVRDVRVRLARGAVITGTVRDTTGESISNLDVYVRRVDGGLDPSPSIPLVRADDRGVFRIFGLAAGRYVVGAVPPGIGALEMPSEAEVDQVLRELQQDRVGQIRGNAPPGSMRAARSVAPVQPARPFRNVPVYYPSAFTPEDAEVLLLNAGEERAGVDITVRPVSASDITGRVVAPGLTPIRGAIVGLTRATPLGGAVPIRTDVRPDGTFQFQRVAPGRYLIVATVSPSAQPDRPVSCQFASQELSVTGSDVSGVSLDLRSCLKVAGRLVFEGPTIPPPSSFQGGHVILEPDISSRAITPLPLRWVGPEIGADGTFVLGERGEVLPGAYLLRVELPRARLGQGWWLRSAVVDGRDVLDAPLELTANSPATSTVIITYTDRHTTLSGALESDSLAPALEYTVLAFTTNREWWRAPYRRVRTQRVGTNGQFLFQDLPPGEYYLAALTDLAPNDWRDPEFLAQVVAASVRVTINPGEQKVQSLRISRSGCSLDRDLSQFEIRDLGHAPVQSHSRR